MSPLPCTAIDYQTFWKQVEIEGSLTRNVRVNMKLYSTLFHEKLIGSTGRKVGEI